MQRPATTGVAMTALLSLLAILTFAAPAGVAASGPCKAPRSAKTIASDGGSKAWRVTTDGGPGAPDIREYFACKSLRHPFRFEKGDTGADSLLDVPSAAIGGRFLAYGRIRMHGLGTSRARVIVRDLRTHKTTFARRAVSKQQELERFHHVVVRSGGSVAWIASNIVGGEGVRVLEVWKHEAGGSQRLDSGTDIARRSLRLTSADGYGGFATALSSTRRCIDLDGRSSTERRDA